VSALKNVAGAGTVLHLWEADLSVDRQSPCNACNLYFVTGSDGSVELTPRTHPVSLGGGRWGYVSVYEGSLGQQFQWYIGQFAYAMRCACTDAQYARIARSMVRVR
jgi:hypothetical protein